MASSDEIKDELEKALRKVYDSDDFASGIIARTRTPENWETMLSFIDKAQELGDEVTHDNLVALSIVLKKKLRKG